jgi:hypothetical protein
LQLASNAARKSAPPTSPMLERRKGSVEIRENCRGEYRSEDDGCCKYRSRIRSKTLIRSVKICDNCGEEDDSEGDECCKWRVMEKGEVS